MQTLYFVSGLHNCLEFSQPVLFISGYANTENVFYCLIIFVADWEQQAGEYIFVLYVIIFPFSFYQEILLKRTTGTLLVFQETWD